jgi:predicted nucleic acid-binding Zn ribbon protein
MRRLAPRPLGIAVERLTGGLEPATPLARIQRAWEGVVGPGLAAHATPLREREGRLTVYCPDAVWMHEVSLMAPGLIADLNAALGGKLVRELRCVATAG